jgi:hypothetical protein
MNMSSLWTDLLFLHGHITDWRLARRLSRTPPSQKSTPAALPGLDQQHSTPKPRGTLTLRLCLGIGGGELHRQ